VIGGPTATLRTEVEALAGYVEAGWGPVVLSDPCRRGYDLIRWRPAWPPPGPTLQDDLIVDLSSSMPLAILTYMHTRGDGPPAEPGVCSTSQCCRGAIGRSGEAHGLVLTGSSSWGESAWRLTQETSIKYDEADA
jgi:hypothetical protein